MGHSAPAGTKSYVPGYLRLHEAGKLSERIEQLTAILAECRLCPRQCKKNRLKNEKGLCQTGSKALVASYNPHFGEESPLVGIGGSGTIFFSGCNLLCLFCQNYEISHEVSSGIEVEPGQLAAIMLSLQKQGCHNINFVTPSHVISQIIQALPLAIDKGLSIPLVYNSSGYDSLDTLRLLDGIIDIYMPDFKFWSQVSAKKYCKAPDYPERARDAIKEMHRQVGDLVMDRQGIARRGLLVRHLVMPEGLSETEEILQFLAESISAHTYVNVMDQYRPCGLAAKHLPLNRSLTAEEYQEALRLARQAGLQRLDEKNWSNVISWLGNSH